MFKASLSELQRKSEVSLIKNQQARTTQILLAANSGRIINDYVFSHESSTLPPSLTRKGSLHHGNKSEILDCIVHADLDNQRPVTTDAVLYSAVLIKLLCPGSSMTIRDYATDVFEPYILSCFERNNKVDIVWDVYYKMNLKSGTREQRGSGARWRIHSQPKLQAIGLPSFVLI